MFFLLRIISFKLPFDGDYLEIWYISEDGLDGLEGFAFEVFMCLRVAKSFDLLAAVKLKGQFILYASKINQGKTKDV